MGKASRELFCLPHPEEGYGKRAQEARDNEFLFQNVMNVIFSQNKLVHLVLRSLVSSLDRYLQQTIIYF